MGPSASPFFKSSSYISGRIVNGVCCRRSRHFPGRSPPRSRSPSPDETLRLTKEVCFALCSLQDARETSEIDTPGYGNPLKNINISLEISHGSSIFFPSIPLRSNTPIHSLKTEFARPKSEREKRSGAEETGCKRVQAGKQNRSTRKNKAKRIQ